MGKFILALVVAAISASSVAWSQNPGQPDAPNADLNAVADKIFAIFAGATKFEHNQQTADAKKEHGPDTPPPVMRRPVFSKAHGCVKAQFQVDSQLPTALQVGVFANSKKPYDAWLRFSNDGPVGPDTVADGNPARGLSIKLVGVPGPKLLEPDAETQDFLLENYPTFFAATAQDFLAFNQDFDGFIKAHAKEKQILDAIGAIQMADPLAVQYWTPTPYRLGSANAMKYTVKPCEPQNPSLVQTQMTGDNYLRDNLIAHLKAAKSSSDLCLDFFVQLYKDDTNTPIDDTTVAWSPIEAPLIHAARIQIAVGQDVTAQSRIDRCESLSFNGWHALADHEPLGSLNIVRKIVYQKIAEMRKTYNNSNHYPMPTTEPKTIDDNQ